VSHRLFLKPQTMNAKLLLICFGATAMVSFKLVKEDNFLKDSKLDHIDFSINPSGNEFVKPCNEKAELQMIEKINALRIKKGLKALKYDKKLTLAARYHAADMAIERYFKHHTHNYKNNELKDELDTFDRVYKFYEGSGYANTENCAAGNISVEETYLQWFHSPGHYANFLNPYSTHIGIGYYYNENSDYGAYWVMDTSSE
jgi:uncharacterized protein YkwD